MEYWLKFPHPVDHEEDSASGGDLDDFIFDGEEWHVSER